MVRRQVLAVVVGWAVAGASDERTVARSCGGFGEENDWLVTPCNQPALLEHPASNLYTLSNGIVKRTLEVNATTGAMYTTSIMSMVTGEERFSPPVGNPFLAEAELVLNGVPVMVGGMGSPKTPSQVVHLKFTGHASSTATTAGGFAHKTGKRGSRSDRVWPPTGVRAEFNHTGSCHSISASGLSNGEITVTIVYELYQGTSAFSKRVLLQHSCNEPVSVFNFSSHLMYHWNVQNRTNLEVFMDSGSATIDHFTFSAPGLSVTRTGFVNVENAAGGPQFDQRFGPGIPALTAGTLLTSFFAIEVVHDAILPKENELGMHRFGLEGAVAYRTLAPQIEEFPINMHVACNGGHDGKAPLGEAMAGFWCYDAEGTASMYTMIDQAAEVGIEMLIWAINMNKTWRSQVGVEFQSKDNMTWFKNITEYAHSKGIETGSYQLLRNARSATAINQWGPADHDDLPNAGYDMLDYPTSLGGTGKPLKALCAGSQFWDDMVSSMLDFWDFTGYSCISQDGSEITGPICTNASHKHHHGAQDALYVNAYRTMDLYHEYKNRGGFIQGMPGLFLEGGQSKSPGGYSEFTYSLPRWTWIHRSRFQMIASQRSQTRSNAGRMYITPMIPYHPVEADPTGSNKFVPTNTYESSATLEPLDSHLVELEWALSQQYGIGIYHNLRGYRAYQSDQSKAVMIKWISWFKKYRTLLTTEFQTLQCGTTCDFPELQDNSTAAPLGVRDADTIRSNLRMRDPASSMQLPFELWQADIEADPLPNSTCTVTSWDGVVHWGSRAQFPDIEERAIAVVWNPLAMAIPGAKIRIPTYYAGLSASAGVTHANVREQEGPHSVIKLDSDDSIEVTADLKPLAVTWFVVTEVQ